jgi:MSHA pilin protein MshC
MAFCLRHTVTPSTFARGLRDRSGRIAAMRAGFTFAELLVVVLIMGIMTAVAVPKFFDSLVFYRIESAARRVKADLDLARQTARLKSSTQSITFTGATYSASAAVADLDHPVESYVVELSAAPYQITNVSADFAGASTIAFDGYGTPSAGGTVTLVAPNHRCDVTVDAETGLVSISRSHARARSPE